MGFVSMMVSLVLVFVGLAIVAQLVSRMGGKIEVQSEVEFVERWRGCLSANVTVCR